MEVQEEAKLRNDIAEMKRFWNPRNEKFKKWYEILTLLDLLQTKGLETYVSNEPQTFYNMAHYLLTKGELSHTSPVENESALELDRRAKINRACSYMWNVIDREKRSSGGQPFIDELSFYLLVLGWYSSVAMFDVDTGLLKAQIWNPYDVYPRYANDKLVACVHSYKIKESEAKLKAEANGWDYPTTNTPSGEVTLDDCFYQGNDGLYNIILINDRPVTDFIPRPEMQVLVGPVGGFPDKGSLSKAIGSGSAGFDHRKLMGRGIFEVNEAVYKSFNKWKSMVSQVLRDSVNPITQEFSSQPQASPEQIRQRGALFHYAVGEGGLQRVQPIQIPLEVQAHMQEQRRELQKGGFNDALFGMIEGQSGYALSLLASSSANQILYPYMDGKHFVISEHDRFWLNRLKKSGRTFTIRGKFLEKLQPTDILKDAVIDVESNVATPKDWLERGNIANMVDKHLDLDTIITEVYELNDPQAIKRRRRLDRTLDHPMSQELELIAGYYAHADYLDKTGDRRQAALFRRAAQALESKLGAPEPGQGKPEDMSRIMKERAEGAPEERTRANPEVAPPETEGFSPQQLRQSIGTGSIRTIGAK
jgi:hypothetical protein